MFLGESQAFTDFFDLLGQEKVFGFGLCSVDVAVDLLLVCFFKSHMIIYIMTYVDLDIFLYQNNIPVLYYVIAFLRQLLIISSIVPISGCIQDNSFVQYIAIEAMN